MLDMMVNQASAAGGGCKKRKQGDRVFLFKSFCSPGHPPLQPSMGDESSSSSAFQERVRALLEFGSRENSSTRQLWSFQLELHRHPPIHVSLYVMEEVIDDKSANRHCTHCRYIGWGHHMICSRRFHFVLPSNKTASLKGISEIHRELVSCCAGGGGDGGGGGGKARSVSNPSSYSQGKLLLHGVMHSNGFGHLLCINGIEGGSEVVSGRQIMDLWDRICTSLQLRTVSLTDTARKGTMSLRLIHGVAYGGSWFGNWGYRLGRGSFGVDQGMYNSSIAALQALPLCLLVPHYGTARYELPGVVARYQKLSGNTLLTLGQLLHFMLELRRRLPLDTLGSAPTDYRGIAAEPACRWSAKRVEMAAQVIVSSLRKAGQRWVPRQDVRDAARAYVGDTGLLDFVLKSIGNHVVGSYMVRRMVNPVTKVLEYCLEDVSSAGGANGAVVPVHQVEAARRLMMPGVAATAIGSGSLIRTFHQQSLITRAQLTRDLLFLYKYVLKEQNLATTTTGILGAIPMAVRIVLDCKQLTKHYYCGEMQHEDDDSIKLFCSVMLTNELATTLPSQNSVLPPLIYDDLVTVSAHATIADLKKAAETHFKTTYLGLKTFEAEAVITVCGSSGAVQYCCEESSLVLGVVEQGSGVVVRGRVAESTEVLDIEGMYEHWRGGDKAMVVDCPCGAKEEDGERMVCCDVCEVWQHTRCVQIPNSEDVPFVFLCRECEQGIAALPPLPP